MPVITIHVPSDLKGYVTVSEVKIDDQGAISFEVDRGARLGHFKSILPSCPNCEGEYDLVIGSLTGWWQSTVGLRPRNHGQSDLHAGVIYVGPKLFA